MRQLRLADTPRPRDAHASKKQPQFNLDLDLNFAFFDSSLVVNWLK